MSQPNPQRKRDAKLTDKSEQIQEISQKDDATQQLTGEKVKSARKPQTDTKSKRGRNATIAGEETKGGLQQDATAHKLTQAESKEGSLEHVEEKRRLPPRAKRGAMMPVLIMQAQEMEELFWLGMGYDSDDGERDVTFNSKDESIEESDKEDSFDSDFSKNGRRKRAQKRRKTNETKLSEKL